jgi:hypothetical protein
MIMPAPSLRFGVPADDSASVGRSIPQRTMDQLGPPQPGRNFSYRSQAAGTLVISNLCSGRGPRVYASSWNGQNETDCAHSGVDRV